MLITKRPWDGRTDGRGITRNEPTAARQIRARPCSEELGRDGEFNTKKELYP